MTRVDREGPIHRQVLGYLRAAYPGAVVHHSANEVPLRGRDVGRAIAKAKANGMVVGYPDLVMHWRGRTYAFEVKAPGNRPTDAQEAVHAALEAQGTAVAVVRSIEDVQAFMQQESAE